MTLLVGFFADPLGWLGVRSEQKWWTYFNLPGAERVSPQGRQGGYQLLEGRRRNHALSDKINTLGNKTEVMRWDQPSRPNVNFSSFLFLLQYVIQGYVRLRLFLTNLNMWSKECGAHWRRGDVDHRGISELSRTAIKHKSPIHVFRKRPHRTTTWNTLEFDLGTAFVDRSLLVIPDSKVHGANMGPIWGRQDPGGRHVGPINFAIWDVTTSLKPCSTVSHPRRTLISMGCPGLHSMNAIQL